MYLDYSPEYILSYFYLFASLLSTGLSSWKAGRCLWQSLAHKVFIKCMTSCPVFHTTVFEITTSSFLTVAFLTLEASGGGGEEEEFLWPYSQGSVTTSGCPLPFTKCKDIVNYQDEYTGNTDPQGE